MFSKTTRLEILLEAGPDALVGVSQFWGNFTKHQVACLPDRSNGSGGFDRELSGRHRHGCEFPVSISLSRHTWGVLLGHGGG